jgi:ABC-2 type transport system ATP-binding protein
MNVVPSATPWAVTVCDVEHWYGQRRALADVQLQVPTGTIFALLGPNGSGKSTLFRLLSTLVLPQRGTIHCLGYVLPKEHHYVRRLLGVVFQSPSLDGKLTVWENLYQQAALYGLSAEWKQRAQRLLDRLALADRRRELVERLSGGLRRRVELAKAMLSEPRLLVMDEPSTGLDPKARLEWWKCLEELRAEQGTTIVLTTHLLEEAERADQLAILDQGKVVATGNARELRSELGDYVATLESRDPHALARQLSQRWSLPTQVVGRAVRVHTKDVHRWVPQLTELLGDLIDSISIAKPTLEDVFIARTGHPFETS